MFKAFLGGCFIGAGCVWLLLVHPAEVKSAASKSVGAAATAVSSGATAAQKALK
jgi:hypothetical protein